MSDQQHRDGQLDLARATRALARYDAIAHDLAIRPSPVLRTRLADAGQELLAAIGAASIEQARMMLPPARATTAGHPRNVPSVPRPRSSSQRTTTARRTRGTPTPPRPRADSQFLLVCPGCGQPYTPSVAHKGCRPVACQGCDRMVPRSALAKGRCPACAPRSTRRRRTVAGGQAARRALTPLEQANRARQDAQRREARRLSQTLRTTGCSVCGNHGDHQCGQQWRLADGTLGRRPRRGRGRGSVWTVRGGLPSLGKRSH